MQRRQFLAAMVALTSAAAMPIMAAAAAIRRAATPRPIDPPAFAAQIASIRAARKTTGSLFYITSAMETSGEVIKIESITWHDGWQMPDGWYADASMAFVHGIRCPEIIPFIVKG